MLLTIDIGNSTIGAAAFCEDRLVPLESIPTDYRLPRAEYAGVFRVRLEDAGMAPQKISAAVVSCVVPALTDTFLSLVEELTGTRPLLVSPALYHLLPIKMTEIRAAQIGTDIVCNAVEAYSRFRGPCIIVDFGTALTFTAIGAAGSLLGAAIAPGLGTAIQSLASAAAQLHTVPLEVPASPLGQDTIGAIQSGIVFGAAGLAESLAGRFMDEMCRKEGFNRDSIKVIATGGRSGLIAPLVRVFHHVDQHLVFHGLRRVALLASSALR